MAVNEKSPYVMRSRKLTFSSKPIEILLFSGFSVENLSSGGGKIHVLLAHWFRPSGSTLANMSVHEKTFLFVYFLGFFLCC